MSALFLAMVALAACGGGTAAPAATPIAATVAATVAAAEAPDTEAPAAPAVEESATPLAVEPLATEPAAEEMTTEATTPAGEASSEDALESANGAGTPSSEFIPDSTEAAADELLIDAKNQRGVISPLVYGANNGPLWVLLPDQWERAAELGLNVIHFPGGEWGDQNNLTDKQVDDFVTIAGRMGAVPLISVRIPRGDPAHAAHLVDYANNQKGYNLEYWAIGNEPNLYPPRYTEEPWAPQYFADKWRETALAMKAVDPDIKLLGPKVTGYVGEYDDLAGWEVGAADWVRAFLETNGDLVDVVSIHRYPFPRTGGTQPQNATMEELLAQPLEFDERILPALRDLMVETTGRTFPVAITELGLDSRNIIRGETAPNAPISALWWGDVLMRLIDQKVDIVNYWTLVGKDNQGGHGIFSQYDVRPVYHAFGLFNKLGDQLLGSDVGNDDLNVLATLREDGNLALIVSNRSLEEEHVAVAVDGFATGETVQALRVLGTEPGSTEIDQAFVAGEELTLPPLSLTLFVVAPE